MEPYSNQGSLRRIVIINHHLSSYIFISSNTAAEPEQQGCERKVSLTDATHRINKGIYGSGI
jgi:hypothetical protein